MQTTFRLRAWHGLTTQLAYTWAHALDEISAYRGAIPFDSTNLKAEYGNGDFDTRNNFSAYCYLGRSGLVARPEMADARLAVNSLMTFHGGQPFDEVRTGSEIIGNPFAGVSHSFSKSGVTWINPAAFCIRSRTADLIRPAGRTSSVETCAATSIYGPGFSDVDLVRASRTFRSRSGLRLSSESKCSISLTASTSPPAAGSVSGGLVTDTIGDFNGAPGIGPGEAFNTQFGLKIIF